MIRRFPIIILIALAIAGIVTAFIFYIPKAQAEGLARGSWLEWTMPAFMRGFPVFEAAGPIIQKHQARDGEKPAYNALYYKSRLAPAELIGRTRTALTTLGCTLKDAGSELVLSGACTGRFLHDLSLKATPLADGTTQFGASWQGEEP